MITLLLVMQRACLCYYTIITYYYVIITPGSIITHYYLFQSPELADGCWHSAPHAHSVGLTLTTERSSRFSSCSGVEKVRLGAGSVGENEGCGEGVALAGWRCQRVGRGRGREPTPRWLPCALPAQTSSHSLAFSSGFSFTCQCEAKAY